MSIRNGKRGKLLLAGILVLTLFFGLTVQAQAAKVKEYYTDSAGNQLTGKQKIGSQWYYYSPKTGKLIKNQWVKIDGRYCYFGADGAIQRKKWLSNYTYYVNTKGCRVTSCWKGARYLGKNGKAYTGLHKIEGDYYYFDTKTKEKVVNTTVTVKGKRWDFDGEGVGTKSSLQAPGAGVNLQPEYYTHPSVDDETLLSYIIYCEAGNQPYEGMLAVGYVIMNRVYSKQFRASTVREVVYERSQFSPTWNGSLAKVYSDPSLVNANCKRAAAYVIKYRNRFAKGKTIYLRLNGQKLAFPYLYFAGASYANGLTIGAHVFYK